MSSPIRLRGHHLLCFQTYVGHGYTEEFTQNMDLLTKRISDGKEIEIVRGHDDVCGVSSVPHKSLCPYSRTCNGSLYQLDQIALDDIAGALRLPPLIEGDRLRLNEDNILLLRKAFVNETIRRACVREQWQIEDGKLRRAFIQCQWYDVCAEIAASGFKNVKLFPEAVPQRETSVPTREKAGAAPR